MAPDTLTVIPAVVLNVAIEREAAAVVEGEFRLSRGYARLASLLAAFKHGQAWRELGFTSFNAYLVQLQDKYGRSSKQLYSYVSTAEKLLAQFGQGTLTVEQLDEIGITKAHELAAASKRAGKPITAELISAALDKAVGVTEIRALAHQTYNTTPGEMPKGAWFDFGGAFLTAEERKTFVDGVEITMRVLDVKKETPDWLKRKLIFLAWAQEFAGTYRADVYGEGMGGAQQS